MADSRHAAVCATIASSISWRTGPSAYASVGDWKASRDVLYAHCADIGRDPAEIERSVMVTSEDIAKGYLDRYHEIGATHFVAIAKEPEFDLADLRRVLAWRESLG